MQTIGSIVTYQGLPAIVTALGDGVCTVVPLAGGEHCHEHFGVTDAQLTPAVGAKTALPGMTPAKRKVVMAKPAKVKK